MTNVKCQKIRGILALAVLAFSGAASAQVRPEVEAVRREVAAARQEVRRLRSELGEARKALASARQREQAQAAAVQGLEESVRHLQGQAAWLPWVVLGLGLAVVSLALAPGRFGRAARAPDLRIDALKERQARLREELAAAEARLREGGRGAGG
jgi:hypothetical protein